MATKLRIIGNNFLKKYLKNKKYDIVLNIGCGGDSDKEGSFYSDYFNSNKTIKIDPNIRHKRHVDIVSRCEDLPIKSGFASLAFLNWVFIEEDPSVEIDIAKSVEELVRVLSKDGEIIVSYSDYSKNSEERLKSIRDNILKYFEEIDIYKYVTKNDKYCDNTVDWTAEVFCGKLKPGRKVFIDCGGYDGCSVRCFREVYDKEEEYHIISFEANKKYNNCYDNFNNHEFFNKAVWIKDGTVNFYLDQKKGYGSSVLKEKRTGNLNKDNPDIIESISLSNFILENIVLNDELILKLDIEGAEYKVISDLFETGAIKYISRLMIEWHYNKIGLSIEEHLAIVERLESIGILCEEWDAIGY